MTGSEDTFVSQPGLSREDQKNLQVRAQAADRSRPHPACKGWGTSESHVARDETEDRRMRMPAPSGSPLPPRTAVPAPDAASVPEAELSPGSPARVGLAAALAASTGAAALSPSRPGLPEALPPSSVRRRGDRTGEQVGRYVLLAQIAEGGMGAVYV